MLTALILIPLFGALLVALAPVRFARLLSTVVTLAALVVSVVAAFRFNWSYPGSVSFQQSYTLVEQLGVRLSVGADSVSLLLILLTALLGPLCVVGSYTAITTRVRNYYAWLLVLQAAVTGVFAAQDLMLFYVFFEFTLIPLYVLISLYGSTNRRRAATKFFLYTFTGSVIALAGLVYVAYVGYERNLGWSWSIAELQSAAASMTRREQAWVMLAMLAGFAVKVPLFPVHTWLPLAHTEAPTAGSVVLAGVLLKLGTYAFYKFVLPFTPLAVMQYAPAIAVLAIIGIIYTGLICWAQNDVKKLVAYSSVSHLGFCVLGLFAVNMVGISGSILYMLNHGLSTGALFFCIGMLYERYHTRSMDEMGGLSTKMPVFAFFLVFFTMASVGLPGLNGFVSEFMCLLGAFQSGADGPGGVAFGSLGPWFAAVAATGMIVAAMYLLYMVGRVLFGPLREPAGHHEHEKLPTDLSWREIGVLTPIAVLCLVLGLYPKPVLQSLEEPVAMVIDEIRTVNQRAITEAEQAMLADPTQPQTPVVLATETTP
ncbi:MAG: NADH-quinone oxidoreductase subunit M [Phycisphaeraceae bacterium]|nr:NADH-quinone oxidoreductase subunit M [Phycisphaeraceae bacterium]